MATLANSVHRNYAIGDLEEYPVVASDVIYEGAAVGENASGYSRPLVAGDPFQGFALATVDNSAGAAGAAYVNVRVRGKVVIPVTGASAVTANDKPAVYASDDNTFTLTSTNNSLIGYVSRWISGTNCVVSFDADIVKAALHV